jgi:RNA polymerase sigma-70 factor (ECF subfamily)
LRSRTDHEEAKDIAQETYLRAFRAWDSFDGRDGRAWLFTIGVRLALNNLRRRRLLSFGLMRRLVAPHETWQPTEHLELWAALDELPAKHRAALLLNIVDGYTQVEVAEILGVPAGTVASWVSSAKARLRDAIGETRRGRG